MNFSWFRSEESGNWVLCFPTDGQVRSEVSERLGGSLHEYRREANAVERQLINAFLELSDRYEGALLEAGVVPMTASLMTDHAIEASKNSVR